MFLSVGCGWGQALFQDDFSGTQADPSRWRVVLPYSNPPASTVRWTNGAVELFRRGLLEATVVLPPAVDIEGRFRFIGDADTFSIVFRSDLTVTNQEERRGVQVALQQGTGRVFLIPEPFVSSPLSASYVIGRDTNVSFRVTDNGETVRLYLQDFVQPVLSATVTNRRGSRLALYNLNGTSSRMRLEEFAVHPLRTAVFVDEALIRTGRVEKTVAARIRFQSIFTNGPVFYTLDGSPPSFLSTEYTGSFVLSNAATLRAMAYTPDYLVSSESAEIFFDYRPPVRLTNETRGGGVISFDPPPPYASNQLVRMTAVPAPGWQFLRWEGLLTGTNLTNQAVLVRDDAVRAVFGTLPTISLLGAGRVVASPPGPVQEYGTVVRLQAVPDPGNYFLRWANAVTGSVSPAVLVVTNGAPGVSALFSPLGAGQVGLTVLLDGLGTVGIEPRANVFTNGQWVTLTGLPDAGQTFLGWVGVTPWGQGLIPTNPWSWRVTGTTTLTARFGAAMWFDPVTVRPGPDGFPLSLRGGPRTVLRLERSSNYVDWVLVDYLTNDTGTVRYRHAAPGNWPQSVYRVVGP